MLLEDLNVRRAHLKDRPSALSMVSLQEIREEAVQWDLVTRFDRLDRGKRSTSVEVRCPLVSSLFLTDAYVTVARTTDCCTTWRTIQSSESSHIGARLVLEDEKNSFDGQDIPHLWAHMMVSYTLL